MKFTHTDKVFWPDEGYTKGDVIAYYQKMAPVILPYLAGRPESLNRHPDGIAGEWFYQKNVDPKVLPSFARACTLKAQSGKRVHYVVCDNAETLLWMANFGCIGLHPWASRVGSLTKPDYLIFDLDRSEGAPFNDAVEVARGLKKILDLAGVPSYPKTSGKTGLHVVVPLGARHTYAQARAFAALVARRAARDMPALVTLEQRVAKRHGKIYIDIARNAQGQTCAAPYALRAFPGATVSTPLKWSEVRRGLDPATFTIATIFARLKKKGDLFKNVLGKGANLRAATAALRDDARSTHKAPRPQRRRR